MFETVEGASPNVRESCARETPDVFQIVRKTRVRLSSRVLVSGCFTNPTLFDDWRNE